MGMDVFGNRPSSSTGRYFRRSVWGWRPLAQLVTTLCPKQSSGCRYWQSNDGDGLAGAEARALADALQAAIDNGTVTAYCRVRDAEIAGLPNEVCGLCGGSGVRPDDEDGNWDFQRRKIIPADANWRGMPHPRAGQRGCCNGCDGRGFNAPPEESYYLEPDDVRQFIEFLRACGGFRIC